jgi:uncharacterized membrane protein
MRVRLANLRERVLSSYWFVPAIMAAAAVALSLVSVELDRRVQERVLAQVGIIWSGGAEGARGLLSTVAGSTITVAGVIFSMTLVVLSLASSQFGPRLLRQFMADQGTQVVLGTFIATFVFCLLVLRTVRGTGEAHFVPAISVTLGLALTLASLGVLIFFIHHVARSIQAPQLVARVGEDLLDAIDRLFPEDIGEPPPEDAPEPATALLPSDFGEQSRPVRAGRAGYVQAVEADGLIDSAATAGLVVRLLVQPGHFVAQGEPIAYAWPAARVTAKVCEEIAAAITIGRERTPTQDVEVTVEQLVEVAVRALSPGINDPFTAVACVDWLGAAFARAANRSFPKAARFDEDGSLRVVVDAPLTFAGLVSAGTNQIRQNSIRSVAVSIRLLEMFAKVLAQTEARTRRQVLMDRASAVYRVAQKSFEEPSDLTDVAERYRRLEEIFASEDRVVRS